MAELRRHADAGVVLNFPGPERQARLAGLPHLPRLPRSEPSPWLADRTVLAITRPGAEPAGHLDKLAALAQFSGARLRLAAWPDDVPGFGPPRARLRQSARRLERLLDRPVETVEAELRTPQDLRGQVENCALTCIARGAGLPELLGLRSGPVLVLGGGRLRARGGYARALVPVSLGPHSPELLRWARAMAPQAVLDVLHVTSLREHDGVPRAAVLPSVAERRQRPAWVALRQRLARLCDGLGPGLGHRLEHALDGALHDAAPGLTHSLVHGVVPDAVERRHLQGRHDLVVVGLRERWRWLPFAWPTLATYLARGSSADLLVIPPTRAPSDAPLQGQWGFWT